MLSRTSQYALRAMVFLAQHPEDWPMSGRRIADATGIPPKYLSNILGSLARAGVLTATPGFGGGFALARSPRDVLLNDIVKPYESFLGPIRPCPFGNEVCSDDDPCAGHDKWKHVKEVYEQFLQNTTISDVSFTHAGDVDSCKRKR